MNFCLTKFLRFDTMSRNIDEAGRTALQTPLPLSLASPQRFTSNTNSTDRYIHNTNTLFLPIFEFDLPPFSQVKTGKAEPFFSSTKLTKNLLVSFGTEKRLSFLRFPMWTLDLIAWCSTPSALFFPSSLQRMSEKTPKGTSWTDVNILPRTAMKRSWINEHPSIPGR